MKLTKERKRMRDAVASLQSYMRTYSAQPCYMDYSDENFIDDVLYGLGEALDQKYMFAEGFEEFKARLLEHLSK